MHEIAPSIWKYSSGRPGPSVLVLGGVHGNELTGIEVVKRLCADAQSGTLALVAGDLYLALGNLDAIREGVRCIDGRDLNRMFTAARIGTTPDGSTEDARMRVLAPIIAACDITIDLHATNKPSEPFLCVVKTEHEPVYRWFDSRLVLVDADAVVAGEPATTDEYAVSQGKVGICYESGWAGDTTRIDAVMTSIVNVLIDQKMVDGALPQLLTQQEEFLLTQAFILDDRGFRYADGLGTHSFQPVRAGETIGYHGNEPLVAEADGVIVFPKLPEHQQLGKPVGYIAVKMDGSKK